MAGGYGFLEAFAYAKFVAPAVESMGEPMLRRLESSLPEGARVVDIGCGGGNILTALGALRPDLLLRGVDLHGSMVQRTRRLASQRKVRVEAVEGDAMALPFADGEFDAAYSVASIKHWPDARRGLLEASRVLRPGGSLLVVEADRSCTHQEAYNFVGRWRVPRLPGLRGAMLMYFRTYVAGQSLDMADATRLFAGLSLSTFSVEKVALMPAWMAAGQKAVQ
ncbi:MAG: class I SAM-dependent methyltransferase [Myxococcales bacterium]